MEKKKTFYRIILLLLIVLIAVIAYYAGRSSVEVQLDNEEKDWLDCRCFYAIVTENDDWTLSVRGESYNDINYRGKFVLELTGEEIIEWRSVKMQSSDLEPGDRIAIYFTGSVLETSPAQITEVIRIAILDD